MSITDSNTLTNWEINERIQDAMNLIREIIKLDKEKQRLANEAYRIAKPVFQQTNAPYMYDPDQPDVIIHIRQPSSCKNGINPITHARTPHTVKKALKSAQDNPQTYQQALSRINHKPDPKATTSTMGKVPSAATHNNPYGI